MNRASDTPGELPDPLVPAEVDLRGYEFMPYYGDRLRESDLNSRASDAEYRAAHNLWWSSWKQIPASSLPDDDVILCKLADLGRDQKTWLQVKDRALHGFVLCSDGRYYHRILSMLALDAWNARVTASAKGKAGASKRWGKQGHLPGIAEASPLNGTGNATAKKNDSKGEERIGEESKPKSSARAARLPADWALPEDWLIWTRTEKPDWPLPYIRGVADQFRDYWVAKPGKDATKLDWEATWRNWVRREKGPQSGRAPAPGGGKQTALEQHNLSVAAGWKPPETADANR